MSLNETANFLVQQVIDKKVPSTVKPLLGLVFQLKLFAVELKPDEIEDFFRDIMQTVMYAMDDSVSLETFENHVAVVILKYKNEATN